jgi:uncharacterized membrane protein
MKMKRIVASVLSVTLFTLPFALPVMTSAQEIEKNLQCGANLKFDTTGDATCETDDSGFTAAQRVDQIVSQIINIMSLVVGVVAVIMIIIGGFKYVTSGGDSGNVTGAKNTILYAVVGLVVVALAQVIVRFVVDRATLQSTTGGATD